jgi:hypothetical protein
LGLSRERGKKLDRINRIDMMFRVDFGITNPEDPVDPV